MGEKIRTDAEGCQYRDAGAALEEMLADRVLDEQAVWGAEVKLYDHVKTIQRPWVLFELSEAEAIERSHQTRAADIEDFWKRMGARHGFDPATVYVYRKETRQVIACRAEGT